VEELQVKYVRMLHDWRPNALILGKDEDDKRVNLIGPFNAQEMVPKCWYRFYGKWKVHKEYGRQFHFRTLVEVQPIDESGMIEYLRRAPGMTKDRARRVVSHYGSDAATMLRLQPRIVCLKCNMPRFSFEKAEEASEYLERYSKIELALIELVQLFKGRGFPYDLSKKCVDKWGNVAIAKVRDNPYLLLEFRGCGFPLVDSFYLDLGLDPDAIERQTLCIWYRLYSDRDGHTWLSREVVEKDLKEKISGTKVNMIEAEACGIQSGQIKKCEDEGLWLAERSRAANEETIAERVAFMLKHFCQWPEVGSFDVSEHQKCELRKSLECKIGVFSGTPGTGKTYCAAQIINEIDRRGSSFALCAPTGKAAVRFTEALKATGANEHATTVHSLLGVEILLDGGYQFIHNEKNRLTHKFVIVDEASMLDTDLLASLLSALPDYANLLLIGDINQLAPVGHGAPLRDLIECGHVPVGELTEIRRNSGTIVETCDSIKKEKRIKLATKLSLPEVNLAILRHNTDESTINCVTNTLFKLWDRMDAIWDIQVICARRKDGELSRDKLNPILREFLNLGNSGSKSAFWDNDKVICDKNSWFPAVDAASEPTQDTISRLDESGNLKIYVANGDLGRVISDEANRTIVQFLCPSRFVVVPRAEGKECLSLAYAITAHKCQGSEWPVTIVILDESFGATMVCDRSWIYTAISRAKQACILIGKDQTMVEMCRRTGLKRRKTFLANLIEEMVDGDTDGAISSPPDKVQEDSTKELSDSSLRSRN